MECSRRPKLNPDCEKLSDPLYALVIGTFARINENPSVWESLFLFRRLERMLKLVDYAKFTPSGVFNIPNTCVFPTRTPKISTHATRVPPIDQILTR